jgi:hypothetical protein
LTNAVVEFVPLGEAVAAEHLCRFAAKMEIPTTDIPVGNAEVDAVLPGAGLIKSSADFGTSTTKTLPDKRQQAIPHLVSIVGVTRQIRG